MPYVWMIGLVIMACSIVTCGYLRTIRRYGRPLIIAHRGGAYLWPENTLFAFRESAALGVDGLELDVHLSSDDEVVVIHDYLLDRTTKGTGLVRKQSYNELKQLDAGYWFTKDGGETYPYRGKGIAIPTLGQVLRSFPHHLVHIEMKQYLPPIEQAVAEIIQETRAQDRVTVASASHASINRFRTMAPEVVTAASPWEVKTFYALHRLNLSFLYPFRVRLFQIPNEFGQITLLSRKFVEDASRLGIEIQVWTINEEKIMREMISLGVDGIMTDRPDVLIKLLDDLQG